MPNSIVITVKKKLRSVGKSSINLGNQSILELTLEIDILMRYLKTK